MALESSALSDRLKNTMRTGKASEGPQGPSPVVGHSPFGRDLRLRELKGHIQSYRAIQWDGRAEARSPNLWDKAGMRL